MSSFKIDPQPTRSPVSNTGIGGTIFSSNMTCVTEDQRLALPQFKGFIVFDTTVNTTFISDGTTWQQNVYAPITSSGSIPVNYYQMYYNPDTKDIIYVTD